MHKLIEIVLLLAWLAAVYTCAYDWEEARDREERKGKDFPETFG